MPTASAYYFRYLPAFRESDTWGLAVTAAGFTRIRPGTSYPPVRHPADHHFDWSRGRVPESLQIVLITAGQEQLELRGRKKLAVEVGTAFRLFPRVWHRYRPDPASGWEESWVELSGPLVDRLLRKRILSPKSCSRCARPNMFRWAAGASSGLPPPREWARGTARRS